MDQASRSPAAESRERERAVSSEPCSTRPNPFDDRELSSIKRRRTSLSGASASASRSRSVETVSSSATQDSHAADNTHTHTHTDPRPDPEAQQDTIMIIDSDSSAPQTPERQGATAPSEPPSEPKSSKVTLNLRNAQRPLETIPSSPISPTSAAGISSSMVAQEEDVKVSVEESEAEMHTRGYTPDPSASSDSDTGSPPVEIIDIQPDEDEGLGGESPRISLLHSLQGGMLTDPTIDFPYRDNLESLQDSVMKLESYITTHDEVAPRLKQYIDNYLVWAGNSDYFTVHNSYQQFRPLWATLPQLIWQSACRKVSTNRHPQLPEAIADLHCSFAKLAAFFVGIDVKTLRHHSATQDTRQPDLIYSGYIHSLALLTQREDLQLQTDYLQDPDWDDPTTALDNFQAFHQIQGGTLTILSRLTQSIATLIPQFPKLVDGFGGIALLVANFMNEGYRKSQLPSSFTSGAEQAKLRMPLGPQFYQTLSNTLSMCIEKYVNHLTHESTLKLINGLTDIMRVTLLVEHPMVVERMANHRHSNPAISPQSTAEVMAYDWRFSIFSKLIMSSQMQLRVMSVTQMCLDLVSLWKKYNENMHESQNRAVLVYFANFLQESGLVTYILGPTCHPEITLESGNIIGFLLVTQTYTSELTDLMWQTVTSSQDPRVADALVRMTARATNLWTYENMAYLCTKIQSLPIEAFTPTLRELCDAIFKQMHDKAYERSVSDNFPYFLCVRLVKEASAFGTPAAPVAHPDIQHFAMSRFTDMLKQHPPNLDARKELYRSCMQDLADKVPYTLGSLWVVTTLSRPFLARELQMLTAEYGLTKLLVDEMEHAISLGKEAGYPCVISGQVNNARRDIWQGIILQHPSTITADLGPRLWNLLVGPGAGCQEDRYAAWHILNGSLRRNRANSFLLMCFAEYLPSLPPECFCPGTLEFVLEGILPPLNEPDNILLDEEDNPVHSGIEQLWRLILTALENTIEQRAIQALVRDVYVESKSIQSFPLHRARKVHLALVTRCLNQLSAAARKLKAFSDGTTSGDDEPMVIVATEAQIHEQELLFVRSLAVIREFLKLHRAKAQFSTPDMRSLVLPASSDVEGESAELKYQSFDGDKQTDVKPLNIGKRNTAGSLLASLRDATGFDNYRIYYKGQPFVPMETDICKSLEDLQIHNGLILVKRESDEVPSPARMRPGSSPVEIEILAHFEELWECLSMEEKLASEIYQFLVKLPLDDGVLLAFQRETTAYKDVFPIGQPFKSLYAIHALQEYLLSQFNQARSEIDESSQVTITAYSNALRRALSLIVAAISDQEVIGRGCSPDLQVFLSVKLVETLVKILTDPFRPDTLAEYLDKPLLERLFEILTSAVTSRPTDSSTKLVNGTFQAIIESCLVNRDVWDEFCRHTQVCETIQQLLLDDSRPVVRKHTLKLVGEKIAFVESSSVVRSADFQEFFWPVVFDFVPAALNRPKTCEETFSLILTIYKSLRKASSPVLDIEYVLQRCSEWLLKYTTYEDITQPDLVDVAAFGLVRLIHCIVCSEEYPIETEVFPPNDFVKKLMWRHLFPRWSSHLERLPKVILHNHTRTMLIEIIFALVEQDASQMKWLLCELNRLVPFDDQEDEDPYSYELPQQFERSKAIRSSCGYVGLRNLSNTCYLNSLFTQLFMNIGFRRFMLNAETRDPSYGQNLLIYTQSLFGYLQDSIRRFVDPTNCVTHIKTYDDTTIDIHNQMDVDEFYNLLFDRWEGQLLSADAKRQFRSFYGGQLVQQVKSKECEHISERLEPFSAIQCDIKGKNTLQESLQAYVDGEVMEGDNKYKCSTCDRHVDAVKRACLKDIPDNLIFHLKRFDFNLRTLQRSKINDYFAFPSRIDMRPYTIEHLSNSAEGLPSDIFELVGVLVHSGTAESGHYYSYIRERPTANSSETWVEFNDDIVTSWDPAQMENSCFGGADYRPPFDANGVVYEKNYSAYMLFYQRSSSLQKEQDLLVESKQPSPLHVAMPRPLATTILAENTSLLRRHCIYDPAHIRFVDLAVEQARAFEKGICSLDHSMEDLAIEMALSHLDQVASRTKDIPDFRKLWSRIQGMCQDCGKCCLAVYEYFRDRHEVLRMLVQRNPEPFVRLESGYLLIRALEGIKEDYADLYSTPPRDVGDMMSSNEEPDVVHGVASMFKLLWESFHQALRSWTEFFGLMLAFVKLGRAEMSAFLEEDYFKKLVYIIMADTNMELPAQYSRMLVAVSRRMTTRPPSYENIIALIETILTSVLIEYSDQGDVLLPEDHNARIEWMTLDDRESLFLTKQEHSSLLRVWGRDQAVIFVDKLISINQNHAATDSIIACLLKRSRGAENKIFTTLRLGITGQITPHLIAPYLRVAVVYCRVSQKPDNIQALISHVAEQCKTLQNAEGRAFFEFHRDVFDTRRENSGESPQAVGLQALGNLPSWVPGLLGYYDNTLSSEVENFVHEKLFKFGRSPAFAENQGGQERSEAMDLCARQLGVECLQYMRDNFVRRNAPVGNYLVASLQRVIAQCQKYYNLEDGNSDDLDEEFVRLSQSVLQAVHRLTVEVIEDDNSDWENSSAASDQMDSIGDLQTTGDLNDADI